jgi:hypothetical protein
MSVSSLESKRDNAMTRYLVDVQNAAKKWAASSDNGALVWGIANEFKELWYDWGVALSHPTWSVPTLVMYALEVIESNTGDHDVCVAVSLAKQAVSKYHEE